MKLSWFPGRHIEVCAVQCRHLSHVSLQKEREIGSLIKSHHLWSNSSVLPLFARLDLSISLRTNSLLHRATHSMADRSVRIISYPSLKSVSFATQWLPLARFLLILYETQTAVSEDEMRRRLRLASKESRWTHGAAAGCRQLRSAEYW